MTESSSPDRHEYSIEEMRTVNPDPLLTIEQAALYLNLKVTHVQDLSKQRRLNKQAFGRPVRIRQSECERLIRESTVPAVQPLNRSRFE